MTHRASYLFRDNRRQAVLRGILRLCDAVALLIAASIASLLRFGDFLPPAEFVPPLSLAVFVYLAAMELAGGYRVMLPGEGRVGLQRAFLCLLATFSLLVAVAYFTKTSDLYSRGWVGYWMASAFVLHSAVRIGVIIVTRRLGKEKLFASRLAVVASRELAPVVERLKLATSESGFFVDRVYYVSGRHVPAPGDHPYVEEAQDLLRRLQSPMPDAVVLTLTKEGEEAIKAVYDEMLGLPVNILVYPFAEERPVLLDAGDWVVMSGLPFIRRQSQPFGSRGWLVKLAEDYALAAIFVILLSPVMLLIALAIRLDGPGPVLFRQKRHGFTGETIEVYKFRTMKHDRGDEPGVPQATRNDPRITRVGRLLRRCSLDELPQLINVLQGRMSLIGPRPHAVEHNDYYRARIDGYLGRHRVRPGITGWAQVNGWRGETDTEEKMIQRVRHDLYYIQNWSLGLDVRILLMTAVTVFFQRNAY
jgi:putative colanic acid biosynthesis UDP-glucose lipid carrier transferase